MPTVLVSVIAKAMSMKAHCLTRMDPLKVGMVCLVLKRGDRVFERCSVPQLWEQRFGSVPVRVKKL